MTRDELYELHENMAGDALRLMRAKNVDYASTADPFRNFRTFGLLGVVVRLSDKMARLHSLVERGVDQNKVKDETYVDTCLDIINYAVIFAAMVREVPREYRYESAPDGTTSRPPELDLPDGKPCIHPSDRRVSIPGTTWQRCTVCGGHLRGDL